MKNIYRFICLFLFVLLMVLPANAAVATENTTDFQGGKGTQAEPYLVSTAAQLDNVRKYPNAHFKQTATILLSDYGNWTPIGTESAPFYGTYDGNGYTIYGLTITRSGSASAYLGLFGYSRGYISGVKLENVSIIGTFTYSTGCNMGAVAGYSSYEIVGCSVSGSIQCTLSNNGANIGGIVGYGNAASYCQNSADITVMTSAASPSVNYVNIGGVMGNGYDDIAYCTNSGDIYSNCSNTEMGGVCGNAWTLIGCSNSGSVTLDTFSTRTTNSSNWNKVGGVTGYLVSSAKDCTNSGAVIASGYNCDAGGIAGRFEGSSNADVIDQCRVSGSVSTVGESGSANTTYGHIGGVVGAAQGGDITNCYAVGTVKLNNNSTDTCLSGGIVGEVEADDTVVDSCYSLVNSIATNTGASWWARGALVGYNSGIVTNCYWSSYSWGVATNAGTDNSKSVTLSKFKTQSTYSGFDFTNVWKMGTGTYTYATLKMESGHTHSLTYTAENYNCGSGGNLAHWYCAGCDTYFRGQGTKPVAERMVKVYAGDHTYDFDKEPSGTYGGHAAFACIDCGTALAPDGQCGKTVWYNQIGDALYIYGSGSMYNYNGYSCYSDNGDTPWKNEAITFVDIKKGVTTVGQGAFYYSCDISSYRDDTNKYLTTVRLPDGLLTVDESAFAYCTVLKSINIPDSVSFLGRYAFRDCRSLETLSMNVDTVSSYCFEFCTSLKEITFGPNLYTIANTVFDKGTTNKEILKITFLGDAPYFDSITFNRQTVEAHYPICNTTWTDSVKQNYSGTVTWVADGSHTPGEPTQTDISPATCTEDGSYTEVIACQTCNAVISSTPKVIDKLDHSFTNYSSNGDATYDADGTKTAKCDRCDETDTVTDEGSKLIRNGWFQIDGKWYYYLNGTCQIGWLKNGNTWYYFDSAGAMVTGVVSIDGTHHVFSEVGAWLGSDHSFTNYISDGNATCEADGTKTARCDYDNCEATDTVTDEGSKLDHSFTNYISNNDATCTADGTKTAKCDHCEVTDTQTDVGSAKGHDHDTVVTAPTCTEKGYTTHTCHCGDSYVDSEVPALNHSFTDYKSNNDATCTADGTKTAKCDRCDVTDTQADVDTKLGHSFTNYISDGNATCTEDGTETAKCDRCEETDTQADADSKLGHSFTNYTSDNNATCTEDGTETAKCDRCEETDTQTDADSKLGHSFTSYVSDNNATCTEDGTETAKCDRCDVTDTQNDAGSKLGHDMGDWATTQAPTCTEDGIQQKDCTRCDHSETQTIGATGHSYGDWVVIGPGMQQQSCHCGDTLSQYNTGWALWENKWYFRKADNTLAIGWFLDGNIWYFLDSNGVMQTGWLQDGGAWYYLQSSGAMATGWVQDGGTWYYMQPSGAMVTGWRSISGSYYYFSASGAMKTGWVQDGSIWYYMKPSGAMATGWQAISGKYYYFASSGAMKTGWLKDGNLWYYLNTNGDMHTGWLQLGSNWYYMNSSGAMVTGTQYIGGSYYTFDQNGVWIP